MLGTAFLPDTQPVMVGDQVVNMSPADMATKFGVGNIETPATGFAYEANNTTTVQVIKDLPFVPTAPVLTALRTGNAPLSPGKGPGLDFTFPTDSQLILSLFGSFF